MVSVMVRCLRLTQQDGAGDRTFSSEEAQQIYWTSLKSRDRNALGCPLLLVAGLLWMFLQLEGSPFYKFAWRTVVWLQQRFHELKELSTLGGRGNEQACISRVHFLSQNLIDNARRFRRRCHICPNRTTVKMEVSWLFPRMVASVACLTQSPPQVSQRNRFALSTISKCKCPKVSLQSFLWKHF